MLRTIDAMNGIEEMREEKLVKKDERNVGRDAKTEENGVKTGGKLSGMRVRTIAVTEFTATADITTLIIAVPNF
jgi:hypothetical protein